MPDSEIHRVPPEPPFFGSDAHGFFNRAVAALAVELGEDERKTDIFRIHHDVLQIASLDCSQCSEWISEIERSVHKDVGEALAGPHFSLSGLIAPAKELVSRYLVFSVPGQVVREVLASYLVSPVDRFPSPSAIRCLSNQQDTVDVKARRVDRLVSLFLHLRERTAVLLNKRRAYDLPSFYEMTYLACLLGDVTLIIGRKLLDQVSVSGELRTRISSNQKMLDEELAYWSVPTFLYPALFCEFVVPGELRIIRKTPYPQPFIYPQLDGTGATPENPAHVFRMLREKTAELPPYDAMGSLDEDNSLLDEENACELLINLTILATGLAREST